MTHHDRDAKDRALDAARTDPHGEDSGEPRYQTTNFGTRVEDQDNSLRAGERGPTLMEDFHAREKITHFDHERIPERVVHARGAGAYGFFEAYAPLTEYTCADFLSEEGLHTPVFVRFSTVQGPRGSADTVRDVRGFATKFYTRDGNLDIVGNNFPVFFIQDGIKFPDFVHAVKPEPHNEMPTGASAHDTFWDFVSLQPETLHTVMWLMSDRAIPRSYRMMQGFGVHTFRFVTADGRGTLVKFHWKPRLGTHSLVWDEAQKAAGKDPDFNRRDLWEAIDAGAYPEWELGVQLMPETDELAYGIDLLDPTKIVPEEDVPVRPVGRMVLNRNPDNFFAETEQVAFHTAHVVPGIDFTNDPLLQARNFSYLDTQLIRLGGPNFEQLPVNRPVAAVHNDQRDGYGQQEIHRGQASYYPNSLGGGCPALADEHRFRSAAVRVDGEKIRKRSPSFADHHSQATLFWNSMTDWERAHIVAAYRFELGKVEHRHVRERTVAELNKIDHVLAARVADGIGVAPPGEPEVPNHGRTSPALSQANGPRDSIATRKIAVLAGDGADPGQVRTVSDALAEQGAIPEVLGTHDGTLGGGVEARRQLVTVASVLYDAVLVPGGAGSVRELMADGYAVNFVTEAYKHGKAVGGLGDGVELLRAAGLGVRRLAEAGAEVVTDLGVVTVSDADGPLGDFTGAYADAIAAHRHFDRDLDPVPA